MAFAAAWVYDHSGYWAPLHSAVSPNTIPGHSELSEKTEEKAAVGHKLPHPLSHLRQVLMVTHERKTSTTALSWLFYTSDVKLAI